ncbi:MAG TPA: translation initiation factor IF-3 [Baekduia sp.]|nr:translation initiation factor IF-3 [Baekduia sp.]
MPVPRRFDRRLPERDSTRINDRIRVPEVRVIGDDGQQVGVMKTDDALRLAQERDLDLVEVAPESRPPVCRILDYSKYKYEQAQKVKAAKKHQQQVTIREIKFRPKIGQHDYDTKKGHVERFLRQKNKVKITIMFRGREVTHPELGKRILDRLAEELSLIGQIEQRPNLDGRNMTMVLGPSKDVISGKITKDDPAGPVAEPEAAADQEITTAAAFAAADAKPRPEPVAAELAADPEPAAEAAPVAEAETEPEAKFAEEPAAKKPAAKKPAAKKPAAKKPAAKKAAAKKPAAKKPAVTS